MYKFEGGYILTQKKGYSRLFIILQEQEQGYGVARDKEPNGYVKLESKSGKGKICFYVQNLRGAEQYSMILITNNKGGNKILNLGQPTFDSKGRVDLTMEFPAENIAKSGVAIDKISGAAIAIVSERNVTPIISGFASKEVDENWTTFQIIDTVELNKVVVPEEFTKLDREDSDKKGTSKKEDNIFEKYEKEISNVENSDDEIVEEDTERIEEDKETGEEEIREEFRSGEDRLKGSIGEYFTFLAEGLEEIKDIMPEIKNVKWYKIHVNEMEDLYSTTDYRKYTILYYPMVANYPYISKHGHYYVGYKHDKDKTLQHLIYAIPGTKKKHEQPFGGKTGYVMWVPMKESREYEDDNALGCWLLFYCFKTSTILVPME